MNIVFYFSGTGNSLKIAKDILGNIGGGALVSMANLSGDILRQHYDTTGFVFPVYFWGLPDIAARFIANSNVGNSAYCYGIATSGGSPGNGLAQLNELLKRHHHRELNYGQNITMQTNYILHGYPIYFWNFHHADHRAKILSEKAERQVNQIIEHINRRENNKTGKMSRFRDLYHNKCMKNISRIDENYAVNDDCTRCGICTRVCPVKNIAWESGPVFKHHCEHCLACIHCCPQRAINYKNMTQNRKRYVHPEIACGELIQRNSGPV